MRHFAVLALCLLALPSVAAAQSVVVNPTTLTFDSPDHDTMVGGVAVLTKYVVEYYQGTTLVSTVDAGKPAGTNGTVTLALAQGALTKNTVYALYVTAVGPGGSARSVISGPFAWLVAPRAVNNVRVG